VTFARSAADTITNALALNNITSANAMDATCEVILRIGVVVVSFLLRQRHGDPPQLEYRVASTVSHQRGPQSAAITLAFSELPGALPLFSHSTQAGLNAPTSVGRISHPRMSRPK
jgi:hypothetical protein